MKIISHRANINGIDEKNENSISKIEKTIKKFDCEIDLWIWKNKLYLGHDKPQYEVDKKFLYKNINKLWIHAKNKKAVDFLHKTNLHWFWHDNDTMTLTSKNYIWVYPNNFFKNGITVIKDDTIEFPKYIMGICTDNPTFFERIYGKQS